MPGPRGFATVGHRTLPLPLVGAPRVDHDAQMNTRTVHIAAFAIVMLLWLAFFALFVFGKKPERQKSTRADRTSIVGIILQGLGFSAVWALQRTPRFTSIVPLPGVLEIVPPLIAVLLSTLSVWVSMTSIKTLGKEWSLEARLVEDHRLVTTGPYSWVRHPIYSAMLAKLISTGIVLSHWIGLVAGLVIFVIGTTIRTRSEEKLLRSQFGTAYDDYARRVPALVPMPFR
jgi:protein-S-isoprenylcysteine O-methyltransferase Ste14